MKKYILCICMGALFASCEKTLDLLPKDQLSDAQYWASAGDYELYANEFYRSLAALVYYPDNEADLGINSGGSNTISNGSYVKPNADASNWNNVWEFIRGNNYLLKKAEESTLGSAITDRYVGEAYFFRAYNYWKLVKRYGGVPKIDKVLDITDPDLYAPRATQAEIIDFIISDLDNATSRLLKQSELKDAEMGRATHGAALLLKARVALYQGTWAKYHNTGQNPTPFFDQAISAAEALISSNEYGLFYDPDTLDQSYRYLFYWKGDDSNESILCRRYYDNRAMHNWMRNIEHNAYNPTKNLADMYLDINGLPIDHTNTVFKGYDTFYSEFEDRDPRMSMTFMVPGTMYMWETGWIDKWPLFVGNNTRGGYMNRKFLCNHPQSFVNSRAFYDFKEFRYGEALLILAEALFEKNGSITDADLDRTINELRRRAYMPALLTNDFVAANGLDMKTEIRRERTVELALEGFRRDDLRRWNEAHIVLPRDLKGVKWNADFQNRYPTAVLEFDSDGFIIVCKNRKFDVNKDYFLPIPAAQIELSKGTLEQNPGW